MKDARFPNNTNTPNAERKSESFGRSAGKAQGVLAGLSILTRNGLIAAFLVGGLVLLGEALLPDDHKLRPANIFAAFEGDFRGGVEDRLKAVDYKWRVKEEQAVALIARETAAVQADIEARKLNLEKRIEAVDRHQMPSLVTNIVGEMACMYAHVEHGRVAGHCPETKAMRKNIMEERKELVGDAKILFTDEQLMGKIGLPPNFMEQFDEN